MIFALAFIFLSTCQGFQSISHIREPSKSSLQRTNVRQPVCLFAYQYDDDAVRLTNNVLRASRSSFKNVENMTNDLLGQQPLLALALFLALGGMVAYISGLFFLGGYIDSWNPAENDIIPYWDEEILVISRKM